MRSITTAVLLVSATSLAGESDTNTIVPASTLASSRLAMPPPQLSPAFTAARREAYAKATFEVCLDASGSVRTVSSVISVGDVGEDAALAEQIKRTWLFKPQPKAVCFRQPLVFSGPSDITSADSSDVVRSSARRQLTDRFLRDVIAGDVHAAYLRLHPFARIDVSEQSLVEYMRKEARASGQVLAADFVSESLRFDPADGQRLIAWVHQYSLATTLLPRGAYLAELTVVMDPVPHIFRVHLGRSTAWRGGTPEPILPRQYLAAHPQGSRAKYQVCFDTSGRVDGVTPIIPLDDAGADAELREQIERTWSATPRSTRACSDREFHWASDSSTRTTPDIQRH